MEDKGVIQQFIEWVIGNGLATSVVSQWEGELDNG